MLPSTPVEEEVPVWAYIVPIIIAIIILAVVIVILWKKGFFIRKYKVQMEEKKVESGAKSTKDKEEFDDLEKAANDIPAIVIENEQDKSPPMSTFSNTPPPSKKEQLNDSLEDDENSEFKTKETVTLPSSEETGSENRWFRWESRAIYNVRCPDSERTSLRTERKSPCRTTILG